MSRLAALALLVVAACGAEQPVAAPTAAPATQAPPSVAATAAPTARPAEETPQTGTMVITVTDQNGRPRGGVPVEFTGPARKRATSDASGRVRVALPAASYDVGIVKGCTDTIDVQRGGTGKADVAPDQETTGALTVEWRHRYAPGQPTSYEATDGKPTVTGTIPHWRPNVEYVVRFGVLDRCKGDAPAPNASYPSYRFEISVNARVVDATQKGTVRAACSGRGVIRLTSSDSENPSEEPFDLLAMTETAPGRPTCMPD